VFGVAFLLCLIALSAVGWRLAKKDEWLSAARRMPFVQFDGSVLPAGLSGPDECQSLDIHFKLVLDGTNVWIPCRNNRGEGALARMDLARKRVDYRWPFPSWEVRWTVGLLPLPDGRLATVVRVFEGLGIAVAGPEGWLLRPQHVYTHPHDRVLGLGWNRGALEVALGSIDTDQRPAWSARIVTLDEDGVRNRPFTGCGEECSGIHAAYFGSDARWRFLVSQGHAPAVSSEVTEDGDRKQLSVQLASFVDVDRTVSGVTTDLGTSRYRLGRDGRLEPIPPPRPAWLSGDELTSHRFIRDAEHLSQLKLYEIDGKRLHSAPPSLYSLTLEKDPDRSGQPGTPTFEDQALGVTLFDVSLFELKSRKAVTRVARAHECRDLASDGALARVGNEIVVFEPGGCYVTLDENLRRTDAWGLWDHLSMRGSMYLHWKERSHAVKLVWVLLAPLCVVGAFFARKKWPRALTALAIAFGLAAIWCGVSLWPLLR
jgi:hypothetical protein